ncbi:hypothetical protein [Mycolicibacterium mucogenicum]|uniref:Uncharacterized protein n=1 Tax=Mycolicibacterium mucogenicum DSM 44124 TaxID=1226753 RepID=A0A8E4W1X5_MYCMU|nr:hypothetical protein [Mycolicibacterium mucogenicum]KAB7752896.1 hypothetical protein MMUC44124_26600 [Mycolicibacterium mucogenicum DSM 44124]QPG69111.1 hypothetical protein C1S78_027615 [Mycolicibacterium mucogenicum DSM 44124]
MAEIDKTNPNCIRAREGNATASIYHGSRRITVVADDGSFADALNALAALLDEVY